MTDLGPGTAVAVPNICFPIMSKRVTHNVSTRKWIMDITISVYQNPDLCFFASSSTAGAVHTRFANQHMPHIVLIFGGSKSPFTFILVTEKTRDPGLDNTKRISVNDFDAWRTNPISTIQRPRSPGLVSPAPV